MGPPDKLSDSMEKVVLDAQALFELQKTILPPILEDLRKKIISEEIQVIIPTIAISELLWKMRKWGKLNEFQKAYSIWKQSSNIIIDSFDEKVIDLMVKNASSFELHDEIIAMTCLKYKTNIIYGKDWNFDANFKLILKKW
jgi:predicted nucleic acid-binding protein